MATLSAACRTDYRLLTAIPLIKVTFPKLTYCLIEVTVPKLTVPKLPLKFAE
jgi:hypothetical protein